MLRIALDYDDTYTADRSFWKKFVALCKIAGHEVTFVTFRMEDWSKNDIVRDNSDILRSAEKLGIKIVFTNGLPKKKCYNADIWIDDKPETITQDYETLLASGLFIPKGVITNHAA